MRDLKKDAGAIAGDFIGACGAAVPEIKDDLFAVLNYGMIASAGDVYNGTDAAAVVLTAWFVQTITIRGQLCRSLWLVHNKVSLQNAGAPVSSRNTGGTRMDAGVEPFP